jgi:branched-chain amino acid transport system substrate-binding protein
LVIAVLALLVPVAAAAPPAQGEEYTVRAGDWLSKLADKYLGDPMLYPAIMKATNVKHFADSTYAYILNPDIIKPGQKLWIPDAEEAAKLVAAPTGTPYKIGFCAAITGPGSSLGVPERNTAEMIAAQLTAEGGVVGPDGVGHAVEVIMYDTESNPDAAASVASRLITEDEVDVLVCGTLSGNSMAIMPLAAENEVPYISMASARAIIQDPETKESRKWAFKTPQENLHSGEWQALYLEAKGLTSICDLYENTGYGQDCLANTKAAVEAKGIEVVYEDTFERSDTEFPQMASVQGSGCEALVVGAIPPGASMATVAARDTDPNLPVVQGHGVCNKAFIDLAGDAAEGTVFPCGRLMVADLLPDGDPQKAMLLRYIADYTAFTDGEPISTFGGHALDALLWAKEGLSSLEDGMSLAERRAAVRDYIENNIKNWPGTGGVFNITTDDHLGLTYDALTFVKVENGTWVYFPPEMW